MSWSMSHLNESQNGSQMFEVGHSNNECHNDLNIKLFDIGHSNVNCQNVMNVEHQSV